jgi:hypothetical protein
MPTSFADAEQKITERFKVNAPSGLVIAYDNVSETDIREDRDLIQWVRFGVLEVGTVQAAMGSVVRRYRNDGLVVVQCFTQLEVWTLPGLQLADTVTAVFRGVSHDGVTYRAPSVEKVGPAGGWFQINVVVPFFWDLDA